MEIKTTPPALQSPPFSQSKCLDRLNKTLRPLKRRISTDDLIFPFTAEGKQSNNALGADVDGARARYWLLALTSAPSFYIDARFLKLLPGRLVRRISQPADPAAAALAPFIHQRSLKRVSSFPTISFIFLPTEMYSFKEKIWYTITLKQSNGLVNAEVFQYWFISFMYRYCLAREWNASIDCLLHCPVILRDA